MWQPTPLRRRDRALSEQETKKILQNGEWGTLATADAAGLPLATPLSYVLLGGDVYFHCAHKGQKMDNLSAQPHVCFVVVGATRPVYDGNFTTYYESAVVHGTAAIVEDTAEKTAALLALCKKYLPEDMDKAPRDIEKSLDATCVVRICPSSLTGKGKRP